MFFKNFWPGIVWGIIIFILSAVPGNYLPKIETFSDWLSVDKLVHLFLYFVLVFLIGKGFLKHYHSLNKIAFLLIILMGVFFGGLMEILQHFVFIGRNGNIYDFLANFLGCVLAYVLILYTERKKSVKSN